MIVVLPAFEKKCKKQQQQLKLEHSCPNLRSPRHIDILDNSKVYSCCVWTICHLVEYLLLYNMQQENDQNVLTHVNECQKAGRKCLERTLATSIFWD